MKLEFYEKDNWVLPKQGTLGNKAQNLLNNAQIVKDNGCKIPRSLVLPYEYLYNSEGPLYYALDCINEFFKDSENVVVRSNSPDEDLAGRNPGLYTSVEIKHLDRRNSYSGLESVMNSYNNPRAKALREKFGLAEKGMSLLVQEKISSRYVGCLSDIGELALLTFVNPDEGIDAMQKPSFAKYRVDSEGEIVGKVTSNSYEEHIAHKFRGLLDHLPTLGVQGWEIEFGVHNNEFYIFQTTPIERSEKFEVREARENIFSCRDVVGSGELNTEGILYLAQLPDIEKLKEFNRTNKNYSLATVHQNLCLADSNRNYRILNHVNNASAIFVVSGGHEGINTFAAHVEQHIRGGDRVALQGEFTNDWKDFLLTGRSARRDIKSFGRMLYSPTKLIVQADEIEQRANIITDGKVEDFIQIGGRRKEYCCGC